MTNIWVAADHHFGHNNILKFTDKDGELIRGKVFENIRQHDEEIVARHNAIVEPQDHVYLLGDLCINKKWLSNVREMNGHKRLVRGNHDIFKTKMYLDSGIDEIYGVRAFSEHGIILSHIPLHPATLKGRGWTNIHGHLHQNVVRRDDNGEPDTRYKCVSLEHTDYKPVLILR